jgi:hypothetical protein
MPRQKRDITAGLGQVVIVDDVTPERVADLAEAVYDRGRPEIPGDVHAERQALAREVVKLTKRLDKAARPSPGGRREPAVPRPEYDVLRQLLGVVATRLEIRLGSKPVWPTVTSRIEVQAKDLELAVAELRKTTAKTLKPMLAKLKARSSAPPRFSKSAIKPGGKLAARGKSTRVLKSKGCAVPGCTAKAQWKLACPEHLKALPAALRARVMDRGSRGMAKPEWHAAAAEARRHLTGR